MNLHKKSGVSTTRRILGVDPGLRRLGYACISGNTKPKLHEGGVITSNADDSLAERVHEIAEGLASVMDEFQPTEIAIEQVMSLKINPKSALMLAHARGAILFVAQQRKIPIAHYTPTQMKRLLTGSGKADKEQIQRVVQEEFQLAQLPEPHDVADALSLALCHFHSTATAMSQSFEDLPDS